MVARPSKTVSRGFHLAAHVTIYEPHGSRLLDETKGYLGREQSDHDLSLVHSRDSTGVFFAVQFIRAVNRTFRLVPLAEKDN